MNFEDALHAVAHALAHRLVVVRDIVDANGQRIATVPRGIVLNQPPNPDKEAS